MQSLPTEFENRYVSQGNDTDRSIFETLDLGWDLLSILPKSELKRINDPVYREVLSREKSRLRRWDKWHPKP